VINTHTHYDHVSANVLMPVTVEDHRAAEHREDDAEHQ
jgi:glyoxylase-like metal-dependent hydrolase (beta-lactamase superfamily II)